MEPELADNFGEFRCRVRSTRQGFHTERAMEVAVSAKKGTKKSGGSTAAKGKSSAEWTDEEKAAMKARAQELKAEARANRDRAEGESAALKAIARMKEPDRAMARRLHAIIAATAPALAPKTWYGMPAYADKNGKVVCFFRDRAKFKERYAMLGFNDSASLDDGDMWPVAYALPELTAAGEAKISGLVKKAAGGRA